MKVLVLAGGNSSERQVSLNSGAAISSGLQRLGYQVAAIDPTSGGSLLDQSGKFISSGANAPTGSQVAAVSAEVAVALNSGNLCDVDIVFIALHGGAGENGTLQNLLELSGKKYTGSNMTASAVAMNKALTKRLMATVAVPTPKWRLYDLVGTSAGNEIIVSVISEFVPPFIVKPNDGGSTVGLTKVEKVDQIPEAFIAAAKESKHVLVEEFVSGHELTVAVLDHVALPIVEIRPKGGLYDYEAKYTKGKSEYLVPAPIDPALVAEIQAAAVRVYDVIGASGLARIDFILSEANEYFCLELNSLPGMTNLSLAPMAAKAAGIEFDELLNRIIQSGLNRQD